MQSRQPINGILKFWPRWGVGLSVFTALTTNWAGVCLSNDLERPSHVSEREFIYQIQGLCQYQTPYFVLCPRAGSIRGHSRVPLLYNKIDYGTNTDRATSKEGHQFLSSTERPTRPRRLIERPMTRRSTKPSGPTLAPAAQAWSSEAAGMPPPHPSSNNNTNTDSLPVRRIHDAP